MPLRWTILVPIKAGSPAKSRLAATLPADGLGLHAALVEAMRSDVLDAARATTLVAHVLVVTDTDADAAYAADVTIRQQQAGLNGALRDAAAYAREHWPEDGTAALVGDLPALTSADLATALKAASAYDAAFVPDAEGTGTTLLTARPPHVLDPQFGLGSAARHASVAEPLAGAGAGLRRDVDTADELTEAMRLGAGAATIRAWRVMPRSR